MTLKSSFAAYLANEPFAPNRDLEVRDKYSGEVAARVPLADAGDIDRAIEAAVQAARPMRELAAAERQEVLRHCARRFQERSAELAEALCVEAGKPIKDSKGEVARLIDTFNLAADETSRSNGEVLALDAAKRGKGYFGMWKRVPAGPCSFITPFNFPLNLVAHKVAPALAAGCPFVLKPARNTPLGALIIGEVLAETNLPKGAFSILPCDNESASALVEDDRIKLLSFTGSQGVGWDMKSRAGKKKVVLELGGNAACVVDEDADLEDAASRMITGAFYQSGQSCISVQRIIVHEKFYDAFRDKLVAKAQKLKMGDPKDEDTFIGPLIDEKAAKRLETWIQEAVAAGGRLLCGGKREGVMLEATLLESVPRSQKLSCDEAFGPVAVLSKFSDFRDALREVNNSAYGLQAGVFTRDIQKAHLAWEELEVGGVMVNEIPSWRVDHMPYGGAKESGFGREGIRFSMEEMTELRLFVLRRS
jgi:acyl-CoA reductase-like NAD-dependent aldehyde dehydrogenase